ncbi:DUF5457 domain-containing protein [Aquimarina sp. 2-A2]|uniref:DUF5457 domain-containing protein n=1 Tax=Aquimarina sp. 2-A2 TaxID=3382644 RepID=UPI00387F1D92
MSTSTDLPIHEVVLKIMFNADRQKPIGLSAQDVLWKIDNPEITERYIREVLDWLVREKRVTLYLDKYSLDRYEFLDQKSQSEELEDEVISSQDKETFYIKPSKKRIKNLRSKILFLAGVFAICTLTYLYASMGRNYELSTKVEPSGTVIGTQNSIKRLYLSLNEEQTINKQMEDISYLFSRQNSNNKSVQKELAKLYTVIDSLQKHQQSRLNGLQKQLNKNINTNIKYNNDLLDKLVLGNIFILIVITFTFFKGKI